MYSSNYIVSKIDNTKYCKSNGQFTRHLRDHGMTYQYYWETYVTGYTPLCTCGKSLTLYKRDNTYAGSCGDPGCVGKNVSRTKQTWTDKQKQQDSLAKKKAAAKKTPEQIAKQRKKREATWLKNHGTTKPQQTDKFKAKSRATKKERYGDEYYSGWEKSAATNRSKTHIEQQEINAKRSTTNQEKYGVENTFLIPGVLEKSARSNSIGRDYTLPSGQVIGVRGYEDRVLDILLETYTEEQLMIHDMKKEYKLPVFEYETVERQQRKYYPDIYIPHENKIIEVKSLWWWNAKGRPGYTGRIINNLRKREAVMEQGYTYEVWLFRPELEVLIEDEDFNKWVV